MLFQYKEKPKEGDYVLCTVKNIVNHSVFVTLDEYDDITGMIHISEIAPGRIRNIREFVLEGKKIICMILRVKMDRGQYDLSLRRVQVNKRRIKLEEIKQEEKAEKIIEMTAKMTGTDFKQLYKQITDKVFPKYAMLHLLFNEIALENQNSLEEFGFDKKLYDVLLDNIRTRIKPEVVEIKRTVSIVSYESNGVEIIKNAFTELLNSITEEKATLKYLGSGKYSIYIKAPNFSDGESIYDELKSLIEKLFVGKADIEFEAAVKGTKTQ
jgi:translation initiation factor 2 subunit 1